MSFVRRDVWSLLASDPWDPITLAYAQAVVRMQARPASDPTSWAFQAAIHGSYAAPPTGAGWNQCQHQNWYFLPWHRMYLYYFERIVRRAAIDGGADPQWALPYWNYDQAKPRNTLPKPFRVPQTLPDGTPNPLVLDGPRRNAQIMNGAQLSPLVTSPKGAMALIEFAGPTGPGFGGVRRSPAHFGGTNGALEQTPHNDIHVQVGGVPNSPCKGGLMIDPNCAALDPIFWLHHANIDRLWNQWIALGGGRGNPNDGAWLNQVFDFYDENGVLISMTCAEVIDTVAQLGYVYDDVPAPETAGMTTLQEPAPEPPGPPEMVAASHRPVRLAGQGASVSLSVAPSALGRATEAAERTTRRRSDAGVYLNVEDIDARSNPGVVYGVFVDVPTRPGESVLPRRHVGNLTLFGIEAMNDPNKPHESVPGFRHTFDITDVVADLVRLGRWNPNAMIVTFEPITPVTEGPETASTELAHAAANPLTIGRVSIFVK